MKAAVYYGKHNIKIEDIPMPAVGDDDVLIHVMACGVCGTDVHIYNGDPGATPIPENRVLGHEFAGVIEEVGKNVTRFKKGDRVCADPNKFCGECSYCHNMEQQFCENMICYGTSTHNGGFAEYVAVNQNQIYKLADHVTFAEGAMGEPVSCCLHGIDLCDIRVGSNAAVIGGGMIGLITMQLAILAGAAKVVLIEPVQAKREMGLKLGATLAIDPFTQDVKAELEKNGIDNLDTVIECVGNIKTMEQAIDIAGKKSIVMLFGLSSPGQMLSLDPYNKLFLREIVLKGSYINPYTMSRAVELINTGRIKVGGDMMYDMLPLEKLVDAVSDPELRKKGKLLIDPNM